MVSNPRGIDREIGISRGGGMVGRVDGNKARGSERDKCYGWVTCIVWACVSNFLLLCFIVCKPNELNKQNKTRAYEKTSDNL